MIPLVVLATFATIIASQAIITGAFSLTRQAMQLGWFPGLNIRQTSDKEYGQIYVSTVNWLMMAGTLFLTLSFGSSDKLAGAYGTAVSTTMLLTTTLLFNAMRDVWHWPTVVALLVSGLFLLVDLAFFSANLLKIREGGWIPLLLGALIFIVMNTWHQGIEAVRRSVAQKPEAVDTFLAKLNDGKIARVPGTAVFFSRSDRAIPPVLVRQVAQIKALQETVVSLTVRFEDYPRVPLSQRAEVQEIADKFWHVTVCSRIDLWLNSAWQNTRDTRSGRSVGKILGRAGILAGRFHSPAGENRCPTSSTRPVVTRSRRRNTG